MLSKVAADDHSSSEHLRVVQHSVPGQARQESGSAAIVRRIKDAWSQGEGVWIPTADIQWLVQRLGIKTHGQNGTHAVWFGPLKRDWLDATATRTVEKVLALFILVFGFPLWLIIASLIKLDGGPIFYVATRLGRCGRPFRFLKFRSMSHRDNDDSHHRAFTQEFINGTAKRRTDRNGNGVLKLTNDERVTRVGRVLRKTSLDEIPQFLHVLSGKMAIVGPRPPLVTDLDHYEVWHKARLEGKPGITGLWQVNGRSEVDFEQQLLLDVYYLANRSFWTDLHLMWKTVGVMLTGRGGY